MAAAGLDTVPGTRDRDLWDCPTTKGDDEFPSNREAITAALQKQTAELSKKLKLTTHDANLTQLNVLKLQEAHPAGPVGAHRKP